MAGTSVLATCARALVICGVVSGTFWRIDAHAGTQLISEAYIIPLFPQKEGDLKRGFPPGMTAYSFWAARGTAKLTKQADGKVVTEFDFDGLIPYGVYTLWNVLETNPFKDEPYTKELRAFIDSGRPVDVAVNDPQKLREWFRPRIAFELPPLDVRSISFNGVRLVGGRLCYFFDRRIASYMFSVDGRILSLYVMESGGLPEVPTNAFTNRQGTAPIVHVADLSELFWGDEGLMYFLVGELPAPDLARLAEQLRRPKQSGNVRIGQTRSS